MTIHAIIKESIKLDAADDKDCVAGDPWQSSDDDSQKIAKSSLS